MPPPVILWFRADLRLTDHAALHAAVETGAPILPLFILDTSQPWTSGGAARWWLHHSLSALAAALAAKNSRLVLRRGSAAEIVPRLVEEIGASAVFAGGQADPAARAVDRAIAEPLSARGVRFHRMRTTTLFGPDQIRTKAGGPFGVYTPFSRACLALDPPREPLPAPATLPPAPPVASETLADWRLSPTTPDWAGGIRRTWTPGEAGARVRLDTFLDERAAGYAAQRDRPGIDGTSMLSPHLSFGEISAGQVFHAVQSRDASAGSGKFINEVLWREFSHHLLWHHPSLPDTPLRAAFAAMPWRDDPKGLAAWQRGRTGVPIVDAGMRQLWETGWMHNRVRMIVASFLIKHLLIDWRQGERWFWDTLVDADLANNAAGWQWVAGCGADAAPFFRVFNPVLQGQKFDPDGAYVRRWVPELRDVGDRHIHVPWEIGHQPPIVDLATGRARALDAFAAIREKDTST